MGYYKRVTLTCDCNGCDGCGRAEGTNCLEVYEHDTGTATAARKYSGRAGWVYRDGKDYCGDCK